MEHTTHLSCIPKQLDSMPRSYSGVNVVRGYHPPWRSFPEDLDIGFPGPRLQNTMPRKAFKSELLPVHSPLLRQSLLVSFPPLIDMLKFSG